MSFPNLFVDMQINDLANFLFTENINDAIIELSLGGIENNKDLFFFCLDLFCKGLVLLFGTNGKVEVDILDAEKFTIIKKRMRLAGINILLNIEKIPTLENNNTTTLSLIDDLVSSPPDLVEAKTAINMTELDLEYDHKPLNEYIFKLKMENFIYNINFELIHQI
jgi:hypothetical protein